MQKDEEGVTSDKKFRNGDQGPEVTLLYTLPKTNLLSSLRIPSKCVNVVLPNDHIMVLGLRSWVTAAKVFSLKLATTGPLN